jgi:hypothetical protein
MSTMIARDLRSVHAVTEAEELVALDLADAQHFEHVARGEELE